MNALTCDEIRDLAPAYVLGALERDEELAVAEHVRDCPDVHAELEELGSVVPYLNETVDLVEPPAALRGRIIAAAAADLEARSPKPSVAPTASTSPPPRPAVKPADNVISIDAARARRRDLRPWLLGLAAAFAIVALGAWNVSLQQDLNATHIYQARLATALAQAGQPGSQVAVLASTGGPGSGPGGIAVMPVEGKGRLIVSGLTPTTGSQVYEAWAIVEGHPPIPVTGFTVGPDGVGYSDEMPNASGETVTVALTLEPRPGATAPSSAPVVAGVAEPASA